ncbi:MAG: MMPL family transporter [Pseudomonadota bacterium]
MIGLVLSTLILIFPASLVQTQSSGISFNKSDSEDYSDHTAFVRSFGTDDYILLAVKNRLSLTDPKLQNRLSRVHQELNAFEAVLSVIDLGTIISSDLFRRIGADFFSNPETFADLRRTIPGLGRLISSDGQTLGFIIKIDNETLNGFDLEKQLRQMKQVIGIIFSEDPYCYAGGIPVLRAAFERYNLMNALVFGVLGLLFGTLIAFYIFKTLWAGMMVTGVSLVTLIWTCGFMGMFKIPLNLATSLSFGFILVVSTTTVFHIVSKYIQLLKTNSSRIALEKTYDMILQPSFMCALTTSAGFISLTVSPVEMIQQAGIITAIGVMLAFLLTLPITSFCLQKKPMVSNTIFQKHTKDRIDDLVRFFAIAGFRKPKVSVVVGIVFLIIMAWGIPQIRTIKHLTNPMIKNTPEAKDLSYIEEQLSSGTSFSIVISSLDDHFYSRQFWYELAGFEKKIQAIPGVDEVESLTPLIFRIALKLSAAGIMPEVVFKQIMGQTSENDMIRAYLDPALKKMRIVVHIQSQTSDQIEAVLKQVRQQADQAFSHNIKATLSGQLILLKSQTSDLVSSQMKTLLLAVLVITAMMTFQLKSFVLGMLSLIPNIFPLITIFGIMGWFDIPLDPLTIFAAVISFGLSVDDSIHYLTQLKREMINSKQATDIHDCLVNAYHTTSRSLISTTCVLFFSALGLLFSPFTHVFSLGVLISSAALIALMGDLIFMPAFILTVKPINAMLSIKIKKYGMVNDAKTNKKLLP